MPDSSHRNRAAPLPSARRSVALDDGLRDAESSLEALETLANAAAGRLCVVVEAGVAVVEALPALREAAARGAVIVATALALRPLLLGGVSPTAVAAVAGQMPESLLDPDLPVQSLRSTALIATAGCPDWVVEAFPGPRLLVGAGAPPRDDGAGALGSSALQSAAALALHVALRLNPALLLLLGVGERAPLADAPGTSFEARLVPELNPFNTRALLDLAATRGSSTPSALRREDGAAAELVRALLEKRPPRGEAPTVVALPAVGARAALRGHLDAFVEDDAPIPAPLRLHASGVPVADGGPRVRSAASSPAASATPAAAPVATPPQAVATGRAERAAARHALGPGRSGGGAALSSAARPRIAALLSIEPDRGGLGTPRALDSTFAGKPILQRTLERLATSRAVDEIVLLVPSEFDVEALLDRETIRRPVVVERVGRSPFGPRQEAVIAARLWSDTSWRGGIAEACIFDEVIDPGVAWPVVERRRIDLCVLCGADWPLVDLSRSTGIDALVQAALGRGADACLEASPAPPGCSSGVLPASLLRTLATRDLSTMLGSHLAPRGDDLACPSAATVDERLRRSIVRATFDTPRYKLRLRRAVEPLVVDLDPTPESLAVVGLEPAQCVGAIEHQWLQLPTYTPPHLMLELCTGRFASGACSPHRFGTIQRPPMSLRLAERILSQVSEARDTVLTLGGVGDPLRHPDVAAIIRLAKLAGVRGVHLRTELVASPELLESIVAAGVDVVSVDLHAATPETYRRTMGGAEFSAVLRNIEILRACSRRAGAFSLPWIVPRMQCRPETRGEVERFVDRWRQAVGAVLVEAPAQRDEQPSRASGDAFSAWSAAGSTPWRVSVREGLRRMTIHSDGAVPASELDQRGEGDIVANLARTPLIDAWRDLFARRRRLRRELGEGAAELRAGGP